MSAETHETSLMCIGNPLATCLSSIALTLSCMASSVQAQLTDFDFTEEIVELPEGFSPVCIDLTDLDLDNSGGVTSDDMSILLERLRTGSVIDPDSGG